MTDMMTICKICGGTYGIHHCETNQCPVGGREAPVGQKQEWQLTTFQPVTRKRGPAKRYLTGLSLYQANITPELRARYDAARGNSNHERMQAVIDERDELRLELADIKAQQRQDFYANRDTWEREASERAAKQQEGQS